MEITRTTQLKLDLDLATAEKTVAVWSSACNVISGVAFEHGCLSKAVELHGLVYQEVRARFGLSAQVTQNAIRHVAAKYAGARTSGVTLSKPVVFNGRCAVALQGGTRGRDFGFKRSGLSLWTVAGRYKSVPFHGEPRLAEYLADWQRGDARLYVRQGKVLLRVSFKREVELSSAPHAAVVGMDRGINVVAAVTNGHGEKLFGGGHLKHVQRRYNQVRAALQKRLADRKKAHQDTRSVRRVLKRLSGREKRFQRNSNHLISRRIVDYAHQSGNSAIAMEDLGGILARQVLSGDEPLSVGS